jgi:hypothetical protein
LPSPNPKPALDRAARSRDLARHPGAKWRFQTEGTLAIEDRGETAAAGRFDEVVVDDWLHAEMMDRRSCFVSVAGLSIWIRIGKNGAEIYDMELPDGDARHRVADLLQQISGRH